MYLNSEVELLIYIFILATIITCIIKFYQGIWNIHINIDKQNKLLEEQNKILKDYLEYQKFRSTNNS